ncbi:MAG: response regulator [Spirochaetia bacterium]|nr:response regulator [Spirochaetia bacterium]
MTSQSIMTGPVEILLVEDNPADVRLIRETFKDFKIQNNLSVAKDGVEAVEFVRRKGAFVTAPKPDMVLLDLNLPGRSGMEVLEVIRKDPETCRTPVVILSSSDSEKDITRCYDLKANCYITKPAGLDEFIKIVMSIEDFWLSIVKLPGAQGRPRTMS